jgi:hypothetical protein
MKFVGLALLVLGAFALVGFIALWIALENACFICF